MRILKNRTLHSLLSCLLFASVTPVMADSNKQSNTSTAANAAENTIKVTDQGSAQAPLPMVEVTVDGVPLTIEIASTGRQRFMGLSFRQSLPKDAGMLFVYPREQALVFTMRNTLIPLSIAFLSEDLVINEIQLMNVGPDQLFPAQHPAKFALEVNQGWFARNGIKPGARVVMR